MIPWHFGNTMGSVFPDQVEDRLLFSVSTVTSFSGALLHPFPIQ
jgi:hypothetical protein